MMTSFLPPSSHLRSEVEHLTSKLDRALLSKSLLESKLSDFEREKTMIELEIKEIIARHRTDVTEKMARASHVRPHPCVRWLGKTSPVCKIAG